MPDGVGRALVEDEDGRTWVHIVPDGTPPPRAWHYPVVGPPAIAEVLEAAGWPRPLANGVQAELARAGVLTNHDLRRLGSTEFVQGVVRRAIRGSVQTVVDAFLTASVEADAG